MSEDYVFHGPKLWTPIPEVSLGKQLHDSFLTCTADDVAFIDVITEEKLFFNDLLEITCRLAESLRNCGYGPNDVFSISCENNIHFFVPVVAALYLGIPTAPLNQTYSEAELLHALNISKPKVIFCSLKVLNSYLKLKESLKFIERIVLIEPHESAPNLENIDGFIKQNCPREFDWRQFEPVELNPFETVAFILCSSGTTGLPKGVMLSHDNIAMRLNQLQDPRLTRITRELALGVLPFFHSYGLITSIGVMERKSTTIVAPRFEERVFLSCIQKYKISQLWLVPPLMIFLAKSPLVADYDLSSVVELTCGAAPLSSSTEEQVRKRLPNVRTIRQGYGMTEATLAVFIMPIGEYKNGSSGKVVPGMSGCVQDVDSRKNLGPNQVGELCFKGRMIMKGYYRNPDATKNTFSSDGWLLTGDLGYYDEDKYFYVVDRLKELIKYKGFQVPPAELEALLLTHPQIKDAAVIGVPDDLAGELALAFVVPEPDAIITEGEIKAFVASKVSKAKHLHGGVKFVSEIPKNPSGKILRRILREAIRQQKSKL